MQAPHAACSAGLVQVCLLAFGRSLRVVSRELDVTHCGTIRVLLLHVRLNGWDNGGTGAKDPLPGARGLRQQSDCRVSYKCLSGPLFFTGKATHPSFGHQPQKSGKQQQQQCGGGSSSSSSGGRSLLETVQHACWLTQGYVT